MKSFYLMLVSLIVLVLSWDVDAQTETFVTLSIEHQLDRQSSELIQTGCTTYSTFEICTGHNPLAEFKLGIEIVADDYRIRPWGSPVLQIGWKHRSHWFDGKPFNDNPETHSEALFLELKFGGVR